MNEGHIRWFFRHLKSLLLIWAVKFRLSNDVELSRAPIIIVDLITIIH